MALDKIQQSLGLYSPQQIKGIASNKPAAASQGEGNFSEMFSRAIGEVDSLQKQADQSIEDLIVRKDETNTHDAMIALEKADAAFQLMNNIRAKIVRAYEEVIRTQV